MSGTDASLGFAGGAAACKLALLGIELNDHVITYDTSRWSDIFMSANLIQIECFAPPPPTTRQEGGLRVPPSGGNVLTGRWKP